MAWAYKRRYPRFAPKDLAYVVLHQTCCKIGPITSISRGGLAFEYVPLDEFEPERPKTDPPSIDIVVGQAPLFLSHIDCTILYDFQVDRKSLLPQRIDTRCCGIKFNRLSEEQQRGIDDLLAHYVVALGEGGHT